MKAGRLTCHALVEQYLRRIDAYDKKGPALNALVQINPDALKEADELDRRFKTSGPAGPLHCVPMIVRTTSKPLDYRARPIARQKVRSNKAAFWSRCQEAGR